jgi:hypothetical protein
LPTINIESLIEINGLFAMLSAKSSRLCILISFLQLFHLLHYFIVENRFVPEMPSNRWSALSNALQMLYWFSGRSEWFECQMSLFDNWSSILPVKEKCLLMVPETQPPKDWPSQSYRVQKYCTFDIKSLSLMF